MMTASTISTSMYFLAAGRLLCGLGTGKMDGISDGISRAGALLALGWLASQVGQLQKVQTTEADKPAVVATQIVTVPEQMTQEQQNIRE